MTNRRAALLIGVAVAAAACGHPEQRVVDQYFNALRAGDTDTLTSFAAVQFDKKVEDWKILSVSPEVSAPAMLPDLMKKVRDAEAALAANAKAASAYKLENYKQIDQIHDLQKDNKPIPPALKKGADDWAKFTDADRQLKKDVADAKRAVEREKRMVGLSIGNAENAEELTGQMLSKDVEMSLKIEGAEQPYVMVLRKYELTGPPEKGPRQMSRWFIQSLVAKS
jgi:hypothetical protein